MNKSREGSIDGQLSESETYVSVDSDEENPEMAERKSINVLKSEDGLKKTSSFR